MDKLKLGVIGTGSVVREIYQHLYFHSDYSHLIEIAGICDIDEKYMKEFGDKYNIPRDKRFSDYKKMISKTKMDAVAINLPDNLHKEPAIYALSAGLDLLVPKPIADTTADARAMIDEVRKTHRFMGVDYHKREDPRVIEARTRYQRGDYGIFQSGVMYMLDKLLVSDPNYIPRFFASEDFAEKNTPVSFLTVHMLDTFVSITDLKPLEVEAIGYKQKLASLKPVAVDGYDLIDTGILFENGGVCHIITGWALPNTAYATTLGTARIIGSEGLLDLGFDTQGYYEILHDGIFERNILFRNFEPDGTVSGFGMKTPGKIIKNIMRFRNGKMKEEEWEKLTSDVSLGFYPTLVCEGAHISLKQGEEIKPGVIKGNQIKLIDLLT